MFLPSNFRGPFWLFAYIPTKYRSIKSSEHPSVKNIILDIWYFLLSSLSKKSLEFFRSFLTLLTLSLYFMSPSRNKYRPWFTTQPFIGAHKSNIWLYCFISFSKLSLLESYSKWEERKQIKVIKVSRCISQLSYCSFYLIEEIK